MLNQSIGGVDSKNQGNRRGRAALWTAAVVAGAAALLYSTPAHAASGLWIDNSVSGGLWGTSTNWNGGIIASGANSFATFNTPSVVNTVNLDSSYTLGGINFNSTSTSLNWNISNNAVTSNVLTLSTTTGVPTINVLTNGAIDTISATIAGTQGFTKTGQGALTLTGSNTYSGVTTLNSTTSSTGADLYLNSNASLGTSSLFIDPGAAYNLRVLLAAGVVIPNNITINTARAAAGANSSLMTNGNVVGAGISGSITINAKSASGGHISGPSDSTMTNFLTLSGPIYLSSTYNNTSGALTNTSGNGVLIRSGNVILSGGGSYFRLEMRSGDLKLGATNGVATNAYVDLGGNANGNPLAFGDLDLNGFNQTLVGIQNQINNTTVSAVTNSSTTLPATLTLAPVSAANNANEANLLFTAGTAGTGTNATLSDTNTAGAYLNLVINGDAAGVQTFNTPNSSYHGTTTLTSGILAVNSLSNGGNNSAIGAASNAATNLIFNGGTLQYTGSSNSTDHDFTLNTGTTSTINVSSAASILTMTSGGGLGGTGSGNLTKAGAGTLLFSGTNTYTGTTNVAAGTLLVDGSTAAGSTVTIASGGILGGTGTVAGTVIPAVGGIIAPGDPSNNSGVGTLTVGTLNLSTGSVVNFELTGGSGNDEINATKLIVTGAKVDLYQPGTTTTFSTNGTYPLFNIAGTITGSLNSLSIATPAAGKAYSLSNSGGVVSLTISAATTVEWNDNAGTGIWSTGGNWIGGVPANGIGQTALFGVNLVGGNGTVTLNTSETVSGVLFNNGNTSYSIGGPGPLIVNNGVAAAAIDILNGTHSISAPITLNSATALNTTNGSDLLNISGNMTGSNPVTVTGPGTVTLTGTNTFTTTTVTNSTLNVGTGSTGSLGSGAVTLAGNATLNFNTNSNYNFGQSITGLGAINQMGSATLTVGAISGVTTVAVSSGALVATSIGQSGGINVTGSGSLTASGAVTGTGKLTVNTSGAVSFGAANSYGGGTEVDSGTLTLNAAGALPAASALAVNGGTLDLHGNSIAITNILDQSGSSGVITNSVAATTATIAFTGASANYNSYAAINDGPSGGKVALTSYIENTTSSPDGVGNQYTLILNATSNYSGGTTVTKQSIEANANNALGTGPVTLSLNDSSTNNTRLYVAGGISLPNNITIAQPNPYGGYGAIQYLSTGTGSTTLTGTITQQADAFSGGTFFGPTTAGSFLNINGPVNTTGTATTIAVRGGYVGFGGGGSYPNLNNYSTIVVNATNGIAVNANYNSVQGATTLDLTGNSQTLAGLIVGSGSAIVTNSSLTPATLTVNTASPSNFSGGTITGNLTLAKSGTSTLTLAGAHTYTGSTTISGGTLQLAPVAQPTLVAAYSFDNTAATPVNPAPATITNSGTGGSAMNGTVSGSGISIVSGGPVINGKSGNALAFNSATGTNSVIINSPITDLSGAGTWTVSSWIQTTTQGSTIFSKTSGTTTWTTGNSVFYLGTGTTAATGAGSYPSAVRYAGNWITGEPATTNVPDGNWHMVTYVDSAGTKTIYVDGVATTMATGGNQAQFNTADIGTLVQLGLETDPADGPVQLNGSLDDVNFFSGALTANQVQSLYTTNNAGVLSSNVLPSTTPVNITASGAALDLNGDSQTISSLTGVAESKVILGGGTLVVGDSTTTTFAGTITDAGGASNATGGTLVKQGSGTLILSSTNSFSGGTAINAGLLVASSGLSSLGTGALTTINGGELILRNTSASSVNALLKSGYNGGLWNGATGFVSTAAATNSSHLSALGMLQPTAATTFEGQTLGTGDVAVKYTYYGDTNLDGKVDGSDYSNIDRSFLSEKTGPAVSGWQNGDFNYDGVVNGSDYTLIDNAFNQQGAQFSAEVATATSQVGGGSSAVPEPASLGLIGLGAVSLLGRRRRN